MKRLETLRFKAICDIRCELRLAERAAGGRATRTWRCEAEPRNEGNEGAERAAGGGATRTLRCEAEPRNEGNGRDVRCPAARITKIQFH
ncbi:hypothetical protein CKO51_17970, partial [Rhodopirellula sp. SM50]